MNDKTQPGEGTAALTGGALMAAGNLFKDAYNPSKEFAKTDSNKDSCVLLKEMNTETEKAVDREFSRRADTAAGWSIKTLDSDKNGVLNFDEYKGLPFHQPGGAISAQQLKERFKNADANHDGKLTKLELLAQNRKADSDVESKTLSLEKKHTAAVFNALDTDKSKCVSKEEFIKSKSSYLPTFELHHAAAAVGRGATEAGEAALAIGIGIIGGGLGKAVKGKGKH